MSKLLSVKEVCELTGLNRKLLFIYKEDVKPVSHRPNGYEKKDGSLCDGYKLYDEKAVDRLQQISIFEKLGMKRSKIKEKMSASNYDCNKILEEQIMMLKEEKQKIEDLIEKAEIMRQVGIKNEMLSLFSSREFESLSKKWLRIEETSYYQEVIDNIKNMPNEYEEECGRIIDALVGSFERENDEKKQVARLKEIVLEIYGTVGWLMLLAMSVSGMGGGTFIEEIIDGGTNEEKEHIAQVIYDYINEDMNAFFEESIDVVVEYSDIVGLDFSNDKVKRMIKNLCDIIENHLGARSKAEYELLFDIVQETVERIKDKHLRYAIEALRFYMT